MSAGVWAEEMEPRAIEPLLGELGALAVRLHLAIPTAQLGDPALAALTRRAADAGVDTRAWLLLPRGDGYWIGKRNASLGKEAVFRLLRWRSSPGGPCFGGLSIDLEPPLERSTELRTHLGRRPWQALGWLRKNLDPACLDRARRELAQALGAARAAGLHRHAVTYPMVLDQADSSTALEDALDLVVTGLDWDEISVMVYQTVFAQILGHWLGVGLVRAYAESAVRRWGERAGLDLGVVGDGGVALDPGYRYPSPAHLHADVAAVLAAGIPPARVRVYGLAGIGHDLRRWLDFGALASQQPPRSLRVASLRALVRLADRALSLTLRTRRGFRASARAGDP
jgi:hypothetical protein